MLEDFFDDLRVLYETDHSHSPLAFGTREGVHLRELEAHPEAGVAMCAVDRVDENGNYFDTICFIGKDSPNEKKYYRMLMGLASAKKYNLFIYGLFRTGLLKKAVKYYPGVPGSDRLFMCQIALATRFH